ncbi:MAG: hypothetical protein ACKVP5_07735 [Aestuariivirga sp.]
MKLAPVLAAIGLLATASSTAAEARDFTIATWNLGWHLSQAESQAWIEQCGQPFAFNDATQLWEPSTTGETKPGWELEWGRDAPIKWDISVLPPCDVYQASFDIVPVTKPAYEKRAQQIQTFITDKLDADIHAFQEVSGEQAVRDVLPGNGADYEICTFSELKVQRLAIAWK